MAAFRPNFKKETNIESVISAPLVAVSKANAVMATGQTRFLLEYCFTKNSDSNGYTPVMVQMVMTKSSINHQRDADNANYIQQTDLTFNVPLLCLVPLNSLAIDKVNVDFDMEITSAVSAETEPANESSNKINENKTKLNGKISYDPAQGSGSSNKPQMTSKLKVNINMGTLPLPSGVLSILDLYTKAIHADTQ